MRTAIVLGLTIGAALATGCSTSEASRDTNVEVAGNKHTYAVTGMT